MVARGQDVREEGEVMDALHRLVLVGELQQLEVSVGDHVILGLPAWPAAQVEAVGSAREVRVGVHANVGVPLLAVAAAAAGDVKWNRDEIADLNKLHVPAHLDDLTSNLMTQRHPLWSGEAAPVDVLVATADVRGHHLENDTVLALLATRVN